MSKSTVIQVTVPEEWKEALEAECERRNQPLARYIRDALKKALPKKVASKLPPVKHGGNRS